MLKVTILGAGHGGCAAAVDLTLKGHEVTLFGRNESKLEVFRKQGGLYYEGVLGSGFCEISVITSDIGVAMQEVDFLMFNVPCSAHKVYGQLIAPYLKDDDIILLNPGHSGGALHMASLLSKLSTAKSLKICETNTLSYVSRLIEPGKVRISNLNESCFLSVFPGSKSAQCVEHVQQIYPKMIAVDSVLHTTLSNLNAVFHPPGLILNAGWVEHTKGQFRFYCEGITPSIGRVIDAVDRERLAVGTALGLDLVNFTQAFYNVGLTSSEARDSGSSYRACQDSEPNKFINAPQTLDHRYMHEDVGAGILPMSSLGKLANVKTPVMDSLIELACEMMGTDYWNTGFNLKNMGIENMSIPCLKQYLFEGK